MNYKDTIEYKYHEHRRSARYRGIPFLLSFDQWLKIWTDSGHFHERGRKRHQYVMARFGDAGPYSMDNVEIITSAENNSDGHKGKNLGQKSAETKAKMSKAKKGIKTGPMSEERKKKISESLKRRPPRSQEWRENIRKSRIGKRWPAEQKLRMSKNWHEKRRGKVKINMVEFSPNRKKY